MPPKVRAFKVPRFIDGETAKQPKNAMREQIWLGSRVLNNNFNWSWITINCWMCTSYGKLCKGKLLFDEKSIQILISFGALLNLWKEDLLGGNWKNAENVGSWLNIWIFEYLKFSEIFFWIFSEERRKSAEKIQIGP